MDRIIQSPGKYIQGADVINQKQDIKRAPWNGRAKLFAGQNIGMYLYC